MHISRVSFEKIHALSFKDVFYQSQFHQLRKIISFEPTLEGLQQAVEARNNFPIDRSLLVNVLSDHYSQYPTSDKQNIIFGQSFINFFGEIISTKKKVNAICRV